jgi:transposase
LERRRLQAADLFAQGKTRAEVTGELGVSAQTASRWHARWRDGGSAGMRTARQGKPAQLGPAELAKIRRVLDRGSAGGRVRHRPDASIDVNRQAAVAGSAWFISPSTANTSRAT